MSHSETGERPSRRRNHLLWIGPLVCVAGLLSYFTVFVRWPALRDFPWVNLPLVLAGTALSGLAVWRAFAHAARWRGKILGSIGLVLSLFVAALFIGYVFVFSSMVPAASQVTLELEQAPDVALPDQHGRIVRLADLEGRRVIVTFYRGFW